jgi:lipopolysaccharide/colanic/teichoic acid biosynthesis glycosyltransferase
VRPNLLLKQLLDIPVAAGISVAALPIMALIALAIKLTSRGPVIHRRRVAGRGGVHFDAYKFRTMVPEADAWIQQDPALKEAFTANTSWPGIRG